MADEVPADDSAGSRESQCQTATKGAEMPDELVGRCECGAARYRVADEFLCLSLRYLPVDSHD